MVVSEDHVLKMLRLSGYGDEDSLAVAEALSFPADLADVVAVFQRLGINADSLVDRMGGSP